MAESKRALRPLGARDDHSHLLRLLNDSKEFVNADLADSAQKPETETAPDYRGGCQHPLFIFVEALQPAADDQLHIFRNVALVDLEVAAEFAGRVKEFPTLEQMPVHLLNEEWVSLAFLEDSVHQIFRRPPPA